MSRASIILRNVASNWVGFAVNAAVTLALTPFVLRYLGPAGYGIWVLSSSVVGYYGLLDLGFRAGVTQYLTRYLATGDHVRASECISTAIAALAGLAVVMVVLSLGAAYLAPQFFDLPPSSEREAFWCIIIVGSASAIQFALSPFSSVFAAMQRYDLANLIGVGTRLLTAGSIVLALKADWGLIGVSGATCVVSLIDYLIRWRVAMRLVPQLEVSTRLTSLARLGEIGSFGAWNFLISVNTYVYQYVPNLLIAALMPIAAVGYYALATGLSRQINAILSPIGQVMYPTAVRLHVQGDRRSLERLYQDGSRLTMLIMTPIVLIAMFWAEDFYRLWIGAKYVDGAPFGSVALVFQILLISTATSFSNIAGQVLMGAGHVRLVASALMCGSVLALSLSLALVGRYGIAGVAVATVIASVVVDLIAMPLLLQRVLGLKVEEFFRHVYARPLAAAVLQAALIGCIRLMGEAGTWADLVVQGMVAGGGSAIIVMYIGITASERQRFVVEPVRRLWRRAGKATELPGA